MRAGEEFSEMAELGSTYVGGGGAGGGGAGRWGSSYGGATWGRTPHHVPRGGAGSYPAAAHQHAGSYEAEDAAGAPPPRGGGSRSGLYYSPPGTSYTIVERPSSGAHHHTPRADYVREGYSAKMAPRGTYLGSNSSYTAGRNTPSNNKKRPISPEQVLRMFGSSQHNSTTKLNMDRPRRSPASSPASTTHQVNYRSRSPGGGGAVPSNASGAATGGGGGYSLHELATRTVTMVRDPPDGTHGFGICVKGGKNSGVGVYISRVEEGSVAERAGLRPGDSILEVNGTPFTGISHEEALKMLKSCRKLSMTVRSPTLPGGGVMYTGGSGGPWLMRQTCSWMDRQGRPVSPPLEYARPGVPPPQQPSCSAGGRYGYPRSASKDRSIRRVDLCIEPGQSLGLMIRGGVEYNLGIFITGVDKDSVADRAGLMVGDQILEVNGQSFLDVTHDEAVSQLKYHKRMSLLVRDVGKVPHSCTAYDRDVPWDQLGSPGSRVSSSRKWSAALQMVEEKARSLLARSEFASLCYYTDEYAARHMGIEAYVQVVLELLNTPEKYTLLTELREIIAPEDRVRFDELVYRPDPLRGSNRDPREHDYRHSRRKPGMQLDSNHTMLMSSLHEISAPEYATDGGTVGFNEDEYRSPSEDSGLGLGTADRSQRIRPSSAASNSAGGWINPAPGGKAPSSDLALSNDEDHIPVQGRTTQKACGNEHRYVTHIHHHLPRTNTTPNMHIHQHHRHTTTASTPTTDYGSGDEADGPPGSRSRRHSSPGESRSGSATELHVEEYADSSGYLGGLRSQLGGWTQKMKSWYWGRPLELAHKLSRSFDLKDEQSLLDPSEAGGIRRHQSMQRLARDPGGSAGGSDRPDGPNVVSDLQGNLRVIVRKSKPILGIAIEGGANTKHPLPRIINIHENGAAYSAGGLEVGQLILQVDGQRVEGLQHQEVARLIAESFARPDREDIEFLVVEAKKSNLEPKPTALIFLEA